MKLTMDRVWWYWFITDLLLISGFVFAEFFFYSAIVLCIVQSIHFFILEKEFSAFPVQVRLAYLLLLVLALWEPLRFLYVIQIIGTTAMVLVNYCFLARVMSLMPWNRNQQLNWSMFFSTFFSAPVEGSVKQS